MVKNGNINFDYSHWRAVTATYYYLFGAVIAVCFLDRKRSYFV